MAFAHQLARLCGCLLALPVAVNAQTYRCEVNGRTLYQQTPCAANASKSTALKVPVAPASPAAPTSRPSTVAPPSTASAAAAPSPAPPAPPAVSQLELDANNCLDWYRPMLRDPRGAYWREARRDQRVLSILVYATNGHGAYVSKAAACEVKDGRLDNDWTTIHARRGGW